MWQLRGPVVAVVLLVCGTAALLVGVEIGSLRPTAREILMTGALVVLGLVHTEIASKVERMRRRVSDTSYYDLSSVWTFAAALLLPPPLAATVVVAVYLHLWVRVWRPAKSQLYRNIYTAAAVVLAAQDRARRRQHLGREFHAGAPERSGWPCSPWPSWPTPWSTTFLVITVIALQDMPAADRGRLRHLLGKVDDIALEMATLSLGCADRRVRDAQPVARPARAGPVGGAAPGRHGAPARAAGRDGRQDRSPQRRGLARQGRAGAAPRAAPGSRGRCPHPRPGPLQVRQRHLRAPRGRRGPGRGRRDAARRGAGGRRRRPVRRRGVRGAAARPRPDHGGPPQMATIAERIRARVAELAVAVHTPDGPLTIDGVSTSVGAVFDLGRTCTLQQVLGAADAALYSAKRDGRNLVRFGPPGAPAPAFPGRSPA
jgi:hypothetical protein